MIVEINFFQLLLGLVFILLAGVSSVALSLGLHKDLFWGTVRMISQLFLMGYVLKYVFQVDSLLLVMGLFTVMIAFAANIIKGRVKERQVSYIFHVFISMLLSFTVITYFSTRLLLNVQPWYLPQYFIPLGGMVVGNSTNAIAISLERLFSGLREKAALVEMQLALGADYKEASDDILRQAISAGMIPAVNSLMGMGIVFIPGMMTGQLLAGADPILAIKYQIMVMMMIIGATTLGSVLVTYLVRRRCFTVDNRLLIN